MTEAQDYHVSVCDICGRQADPENPHVPDCACEGAHLRWVTLTLDLFEGGYLKREEEPAA